jgi:hypothetical protein
MCRTLENSKEVTRDANGRAFVVDNPGRREIGVLEIDGCIINDGSRRVDWAVELPVGKKQKGGIRSVKLIELKGSNVLYAFTQLAATIQHPAVEEMKPLIDEGFIVTQMNPAIVSSVQVAVLDFQDRFGIPVRVVPKAFIDAEA